MDLDYNKKIVEKVEKLPDEQKEIIIEALEYAKNTNEKKIAKILYKKIKKNINK